MLTKYIPKTTHNDLEECTCMLIDCWYVARKTLNRTPRVIHDLYECEKLLFLNIVFSFTIFQIPPEFSTFTRPCTRHQEVAHNII